MKILKMTASFGSLQKQELTLQDGLNVFCLPNEAGKSTWSAFLLCMFYGIDTAERATKTNLPAKTRYKPWWGGNMEGRLELEWNGRHIAIERTSTARAPMSQFRAWDLDSGEKLPELTADTCGEKLLGVERSVFLRSAFLGQRALSITADAALEKRLSSLVTSGDESVSAAETEKRLKDARNRIRHNKTGLLPDAERELYETEQTLAQMQELLQTDAQARAQEQALHEQKQALERQIDGCERYQAAKRFAKKREAEQLYAQKVQQAQAAQQAAAAYPEPEKLQSLRRDLETLERCRAALPQAPEKRPSAPERPVCPPVFAGLGEAEILPKAEQDAKRCEALLAGKKAPAAVLLALGGVLALAAILICVLAKHVPLAATSAVLALAFFAAGAVGIRKNRTLAERQQEAKLLCAQYEDRAPGQFVGFAASYHAELLLFAQAQEAFRAAEQEFEAAQRAAQDEKNRLFELRGKILGSIGAFDGSVTDEASAKAALSRAEQVCRQAEQAQAEQAHAKAALDAVSQALLAEQEPEVPAGDWERFDLPAARSALAEATRRLTALRSSLDQSRGRLEAMGDCAVLEAEKERLEARIAALRARDEALSMAQSALEEASAALQTRFAPKLTALAGTIFAELTGARYDKVALDRQMSLSAEQTGEVAQHPALALSGGTMDQLYLALRLAIVELALPEDTPIVLDDALAMFDDTRAGRALEVLKQLSETRQILLFSCHSREQRMLNAANTQ